MSNEIGSRVRYGGAFWRPHHEAWQQSALNRRQYCEAHGIPVKLSATGERSSKPSRSHRSANCSTAAGA
jgi:hypothetical protein